ncbi:SDR family NAD(P)-dependent oxidoreductase [Tahibacter amnicola]|uniref:SDR family oxidoreductase n=1 Tax=Tahibacter amnicola TaxID=2976241 RepID=A0ABY6BL15_9GAMM|nr:SDR family oxidoreductase [Tahibacter amnicola]UXI69725.1 SDR family oxidoreductase [Tahibacter amnicola]
MNAPASRWALVTGASAGIGEAFARELAGKGIHLVLTARREDRLTALAEDLRSRHDIRTETIAADLARPDASARLCEELDRRGITIDILINNAGYGVPGHYLAQPWTVHADFLQVLVTAPCELAYRLLPGMQRRGYGRIANIASLAGHVPSSAGHAMYAASKAFLIKFSQSLALENRDKDIRVCAVCPGFTFSEFHDVTGARAQVSTMPRWMWMTSEEVAREGWSAVERGDIVHVTGRVNRLIKTLIKLLPDRLALNLVQRRSKSYRVMDPQQGTAE